MRIYCKCCDKVQPVIIDNCRDFKTGEEFQDIMCEECHLVIASGTGIPEIEKHEPEFNCPRCGHCCQYRP